ncbi:hypothetical protein [Mycolicibacterium sphagni]|uniref:Uncharacterized protein n=1 Tax=Mycolicibacterium sphagni TaxID=1786 RepID=A0ABX2JY61_9MYCO|nr:hypothetical protein [Mycolicibacterium sphagni]NTY62606.1 hypothetical protein [Mycolicibacterium sphagni]
MELTVDGWLAATGMACSDIHRDLLLKGLSPASPDREPLALADPDSEDARAIVALLNKGQVPTCRAVAARAATPQHRAPLRSWSVDEIDHFGQVSAHWAHSFGGSQAGGPTWTELFTSPAVELVLTGFGIQPGGDGGQRDRRRDRDFQALMSGARRRGWLAWSEQPRSLCAGPSFFAGRVRGPVPIGRRVASAIRQYRGAHGGAHPRWCDIVDVLDSTGVRVFRDLGDAQEQSLWLETEQWIVVTSGRVAPGQAAERERCRRAADPDRGRTPRGRAQRGQQAVPSHT